MGFGLALSKTNLGINLNPERGKLISSVMHLFLSEKISEVSLGLYAFSIVACQNKMRGHGKHVHSVI